MRAQRAAGGNARVLEGAGLVFLHAKALHHRARAAIGRHGEGDDLVQTELFESKLQRAARAFGGEAFAPMRLCQPPADLDTRRTRQLRDRRLQADETDELTACTDLCRPQSPAA